MPPTNSTISPLRSKCEPRGACSQPFVLWNTDVQRSVDPSTADEPAAAVPPPALGAYIGISSAVSGGCPNARKRGGEPNGRFTESRRHSRNALHAARTAVFPRLD